MIFEVSRKVLKPRKFNNVIFTFLVETFRLDFIFPTIQNLEPYYNDYSRIHRKDVLH